MLIGIGSGIPYRKPLLSNGDSMVPSLNLPFAETKQLDSRITFTRASNATYFDAAGVMQTAAEGVARFDHNPSTGESLGLLIEEARTNLLLNSDTLSTQSVVVAGVPHTLTFYGTGTVTLSGVSTDGPLVGNGVSTRVSLVFTPTAGSLTLTVSGTVAKAQLEAGAFPTSYIKTEATALTRAAELASMTGTNFSSWYNQSEGSLVLVGSRASMQAAEAFMAFSDLTTNESIALQGGNTTPGQMRLDVLDGGVLQAQLTLYVDSTYQTKHNIAFAYALNDFASSADGAAIVTDTSGTLPTATALTIGRRGSGGYVINGHISRLTYYPKRLSNTTLQVLSA